MDEPLTLTLGPELAARLRVEAARSEQVPAELALRILEAYLEGSEEQEKQKKRRAQTVPELLALLSSPDPTVRQNARFQQERNSPLHSCHRPLGRPSAKRVPGALHQPSRCARLPRPPPARRHPLFSGSAALATNGTDSAADRLRTHDLGGDQPPPRASSGTTADPSLPAKLLRPGGVSSSDKGDRAGDRGLGRSAVTRGARNDAGRRSPTPCG